MNKTLNPPPTGDRPAPPNPQTLPRWRCRSCTTPALCADGCAIEMQEQRDRNKQPATPTDPVVEAVREDLLRRQQLGYVKYGGTLATNPAELRGKLRHAYEEALDLCNYLKWAMMQLDGDPALQPDPTHSTGLEPPKGLKP